MEHLQEYKKEIIIYGKLVNNNLIYTPRNLVLDNRVKIFNFNNSIELMKSNRYKAILEKIE